MNRSLKLSMLVALALGGSQALAADLGQIQVKSALGQPLLAEIPLHPDSPAELQNLSVQLASSEDFVRAGIAGGRTTIPLKFSVVDGAGGKIIRITSSEAVSDPFLDLLLEVNGAGGKSVREFTILLDPPATPVAAARPAPAAPKPSQPAARPRAAAPAAATARPAPSRAPAAVGNGQYGPVERGQTLSGIARSVAPAGVDVQQMMLAIQQANPDAFYRDNINALKSGAVLRVPTSAEAQAMTIAAAAAEVRRQNGDWRAGTPSAPAVVADTATRSPAADATGEAPVDASDRLALVPAKSGSKAGGQGASKDASAQDLLRAQESLASLQQQSTDLKTRLKDLEDINSQNERLLALKDNEIAELQAKLAEARKAAGAPAEAAPATEAPVTETASATEPAPATAASTAEAGQESSTAASLDTVAASTTDDADAAPVAAASSTAPALPAAAASALAAAGEPAASPAAPVESAAKPATPRAPAPVVEEPWYMQTWAWAAGAGAILVLILLALLGRRRKAGPAGPSKSSGKSSLADRFGAAPAMALDGVEGGDADQDELLDQLAEHPDDIGLHLELVTLYYSRRDVEHFEAAAEAMHAHITDPQQDEWQDVLHMGEDLVPGHPLFAPGSDLLPGEEADARSEFNIDDYAGADDATVVTSAAPSASPKKVSEYNFNFDLTRQVAAEPAPPPPPEASDDVTVVAPVTQIPAEPTEASSEPASNWHFDEEPETAFQSEDQGLGEFSDDPVDTKLDLARAYLDMGDADGARAMLDEVMKEGSQMQQDVARRLLENLN